MTAIEDWRQRRNRRRDRIRKVLFGDTPRPSRLERFALIFTIVSLAYICYRFQLIHAHTFALIGFGFVIAYFVVRRLWWSRRMSSRTGGSS